MRLKNVKGAKEIINKGTYYLDNPEDYIGKWNSQVFKNNNPIEIEIGMGKGDFIIEKALKYPDINFIGIKFYIYVNKYTLIKKTRLPMSSILFHLNQFVFTRT